MLIDVTRPKTLLVNGRASNWSVVDKVSGLPVEHVVRCDTTAGYVDTAITNEQGELLKVDGKTQTRRVQGDFEAIPHWQL